MKVMIQTETDRYVFPEAKYIEIQQGTLHVHTDSDLPGWVFEDETEGAVALADN